MFRIAALLSLLVFCLALSPSAFAACTATGTAPSVTICAPSGPNVSTTFHVSAATTDNATVTAMKIYMDGTGVFSGNGGSIETDLTVAAGKHSMTVKAWDSAGTVFSKNVAITATATTPGSGPCTMNPTNLTVTICTPDDGATVTTEFEIVAGTTDSSATVTTMKIYVDGTAQYTFHDTHIDTDIIVPAGLRRITVKAWDSANNVFSKTINITASDSGGGNNCAPAAADHSIHICTPASGATVDSPVGVTATANSSTGVASTQVLLDGAVVANGTSANISASVTASSGAHTLKVQASDSSNLTFSSSVNFTVGSAPPPPPPGSGPISPQRVSLTFGRTQQFTSSGATSWSVDGVAGGSADTGTVDSNGLYTAPSAAGHHTVTATGSQTATADVWVQNQSALTFHMDGKRTGTNSHEIALSKSNVKQATFGKVKTYSVDGNIFGSALYLPNLNIAGGTHNVVFVATEHDSVYAFDADGNGSSPLWHVNFTNSAAGITTMPSADTGTSCCIAPEVGITSTPVIDSASGTIYVVAATKESGKYVNRLHALDVETGNERSGSPVKITGAVKGAAPEHDASGNVNFNALHQSQRSALLLANGRVYIAYASFNDIKPYHGWLFAYDASTLQQVGMFNVSPSNWGGGIWQSANGPAVDDAGNIYVGTGNGTFTASSGGADYSQGVVKLSPDLKVMDYFTPHDWSTYNSHDQDIGSGGVVLIPGQSLAVNVNKASTLFLVNTSNLGHVGAAGDPQIPQSLKGVTGVTRDAPAFFNNRYYVASLDDNLKAFQLSNGKFGTTPAQQTSLVYPFPGTSPFVSADGTSNGIVWALRHSGGAAILYAFDAGTLSELWDSSQAGSRDTGPTSVRFSSPLVINGHVYVSGKTSLVIYGLLP